MNEDPKHQDMAQPSEHERELIEQLNLLKAIDHRITPAHVAQRFRELLEAIGDGSASASDHSGSATRQAEDDMDTAERVLALAQQTADQAIADARREADEMLGRARGKADDILGMAWRQAEQIISDARARAESLERDAQERHRQAAGSLVQLREELERGVDDLGACERGGDILSPERQVPSLRDELPCYSNDARGEATWPRVSVSVIIPALNEARNLPHIFDRIPPDVDEVILVDGFSTDDTVAVARQLRPDVRVLRQTRTGKRNALACGIAAATGDVIAMVDADGSMDPDEIPRFVEALLNGADFAKGTRFAEGALSADITRLRSYGNSALTAFFNAYYRTSYSDLCYGFNVFWRRHAAVLELDATSPAQSDGDGRVWDDGFEVQTLIHARVAKAGLVVAEVPSFEHPRIHGVSNLSAFRDGRRVLRTILAERRRADSLQARQLPKAQERGQAADPAATPHPAVGDRLPQPASRLGGHPPAG